jgi:hypothetical protein
MLDVLDEELADKVSAVIAREEGREAIEARKGVKAKGKGRGRKKEDVEELHCLCQLPESECDEEVLAECEGCKEWCVPLEFAELWRCPFFFLRIPSPLRYASAGSTRGA